MSSAIILRKVVQVLAIDLPAPSDPGQAVKAAFESRRVFLQFRTACMVLAADQAHFAADHIDQLREFIEARGADQLATRNQARIAFVQLVHRRASPAMKSRKYCSWTFVSAPCFIVLNLKIVNGLLVAYRSAPDGKRRCPFDTSLIQIATRAKALNHSGALTVTKNRSNPRFQTGSRPPDALQRSTFNPAPLAQSPFIAFICSPKSPPRFFTKFQ